MEIIKCGTEVITKIEQIHGIITCSSIRFDRVVYELSYFRNGEYRSCWLNESEFTLDKESSKQKIGFKKD